ncbi:hypothetical protein ACMGDK_11500 [Chryseobacterium sp. DT-3]|uniref:hypothetical protein n=1 Tax=Chryseobacterium sp. DT-3 TaxID=3396164 RepID=UPI003F1B3CA4
MAKVVDHKVIENKDGKPKRKFNYFSGHSKDFWDKIFEKFEEIGFTRKEAENYVIENSIFPFVKVKNYLKGILFMPLPVHFSLLQTSGFDMFGNMVRKPFSSQVQKDRLILIRNIEPKFEINIKIDEWWDMHFNLISDATHFNQNKLHRMSISMFKWYFKETNGDTRGRNSPYNCTKLRRYIRTLYYKGDLKIGKDYKEKFDY